MMEQSKSLRPVTKVQSSINWGAFATIVVTVIAVFFPDAYSRLPPGFEVSFGVFLGSFVASLAGWLKRDWPA